MRRALALTALSALLASGCGSGEQTSLTSSDFGAAVRGAVTKTQATSSKLAMTVKTGAGEVTAEGAMAGYDDPAGLRGEIRLDAGVVKLVERILGGKVYLQVSSQPGWYVLDLQKIAGTSFGDSANPASAAQTLLAAGKDTKKVGTGKVRGTETTHYRGTIALTEDAAEGLPAAAKSGLAKLMAAGVKSIPFDAWIDEDGRLRKMTNRVSLNLTGKTTSVETSVEYFDFGTKVAVTAPPASEVKDGTALLGGLGG